MPSEKNRRRGNVISGDAVLGHAESNSQQVDNCSAASAENQEPNHPVMLLEEPVNVQQDEENVQIKQLQDRIKELEKQVTQYEIQIKNLKDNVMCLHCRNSNVSEVETVISTDVQESMANQTHVAGRRDEDNHMASSSIENLTDDMTTLNFQEQSGDPTARPDENSSTILESTTFNDNQLHPAASNREPHDIINEQDISREERRSVTMGTRTFARWMNSRDPRFSLWSNEEYSRPLLSYISKIYGQKENRYRVLDPLRIPFNRSDELDQLYTIIKQLEKQPGAKESLCEWRTQTRTDHRLAEIKAIFEYSSTYPSLVGDLKVASLSSQNLKKIIPRESINAYFDMICRDGRITADIGEYLELKKENIFGGSDYVCLNERVTFVNVNLDQSTIDLAKNRVDLITCLVTLHHVPHLDSMLSEFARILRPGGYLLLREHDVKKERSLPVKYLNFIHAFMMIARVGEFAGLPDGHLNQNQNEFDNNSESDVADWEQLKANIIKYTNSIQYRARDDWEQELKNAGFHHKATLNYDTERFNNPQALYYAVYQRNTT